MRNKMKGNRNKQVDKLSQGKSKQKKKQGLRVDITRDWEKLRKRKQSNNEHPGS